MFSRSEFKNVHFIVGSPRSGTTWLSRALNRHPDIYCTENRLFGEYAGIWPNRDGTMSVRITFDEYIKASTLHMETAAYNHDKSILGHDLFQIYLKGLLRTQRKYSGKKIIVDKVTPYLGRSFLTLDKIRKLFPAAKLIQIIRDGRDVLTSGTFDWIHGDNESTDRYQYYVKNNHDISLARFFDDHSIKLWAQYWTNPVIAFETICPGALLVRYEEMLDNQLDVLKKIAGYLGVSAENSILTDCIEASSFKAVSGGRNRGEEVPTAKARKGVAGDWKNYFTKQDGQLFDSVAGDVLIKYGYENDRYWYKQLPEVLSLDRE